MQQEQLFKPLVFPTSSYPEGFQCHTTSTVGAGRSQERGWEGRAKALLPTEPPWALRTRFNPHKKVQPEDHRFPPQSSSSHPQTMKEPLFSAAKPRGFQRIQGKTSARATPSLGTSQRSSTAILELSRPLSIKHGPRTPFLWEFLPFLLLLSLLECDGSVCPLCSPGLASRFS